MKRVLYSIMGKDDWEQEGQLTLFELYQKILKLKQWRITLYIFLKTKFRNHIKDKIRQQESDKRKINELPYVKIGEISHKFHQEKYI